MGHKSEKSCSYADYDSFDEETPAFVDVDFDFFNLNAEVDYHAINRLLIQLFDAGAEGLQTGRLTDLILLAANSGVENTIKTDGKESNPCALPTVLSCDAYRDSPAVKALIGTLSLLLAPKIQVQNQAQAHLGLVLSERLINMPVQVVPPMYRMLVDKSQDAVADGDPYNFTHSSAYRLTPEEEETATVQKDSTRYKMGK
ncbi:BCP1 family [Pisolithus tinctorius]|uniref:Uncharacterized protein n=1 Tax=Pisolithus tinctorius Marx 270 TaxID=870435 RepID=A0A0C3NDW3_PISTI|nr:BCP1 family [Pisolithus tinctorius]KIN99279.1 hypothetical protein M404DRAFT_30524 [Pisolithus tinctorius Marx 270]